MYLCVPKYTKMYLCVYLHAPDVTCMYSCVPVCTSAYLNMRVKKFTQMTVPKCTYVYPDVPKMYLCVHYYGAHIIKRMPGERLAF